MSCGVHGKIRIGRMCRGATSSEHMMMMNKNVSRQPSNARALSKGSGEEKHRIATDYLVSTYLCFVSPPARFPSRATYTSTTSQEVRFSLVFVFVFCLLCTTAAYTPTQHTATRSTLRNTKFINISRLNCMCHPPPGEPKRNCFLRSTNAGTRSNPFFLVSTSHTPPSRREPIPCVDPQR